MKAPCFWDAVVDVKDFELLSGAPKPRDTGLSPDEGSVTNRVVVKRALLGGKKKSPA